LSVASLVTPNGRLGMAASDVDFTQTPVPVEPELCEI
jgi:hypothetical protein